MPYHAVRRADRDNKEEIYTFPSIDQLLSTTLPFTTSRDLLERLLSVWQESFLVDEVLIAWLRTEVRAVESAHLGSNLNYQFKRFSFLSKPDSIPEFIEKEFPFTCEWNWLELSIDGAQLGFIGYKCDHEIQFPSDWIKISSRLLATAMTWDWTLQEKKLEAMAEYSAGAGHEINNPLAAISGRAAQLLKEEEDPHRRHLLKTIGAQTYRIRDMIGDSMLFARPPRPERVQINLTQLIETVFKQFAHECQNRQLSVLGNREKTVQLAADETQLCVVISELIRNAINAVSTGGRIEIDAYTQELENQLWAVLRVADNGCGFTELEREHCFDPFYSGREAGRGLGFGLSKCWRIVNLHQGRITLSESAEGMTEFVVHLPVN